MMGCSDASEYWRCIRRSLTGLCTVEEYKYRDGLVGGLGMDILDSGKMGGAGIIKAIRSNTGNTGGWRDVGLGATAASMANRGSGLWLTGTVGAVGVKSNLGVGSSHFADYCSI
jgi:hypothetical protein